MAAYVDVMAGRRAEVGVEARAGNAAKNILLFLAAPWIGLAYIIALPFVGYYAIITAVLRRR
jgi:hypothetical protein